MSPYAQFYGSFAQQPLLLWCAAAVGLAVVALHRAPPRSVTLFCLAFGLVPFADAWLTADRVAGIGSLPPTVGVVLATTFVIVGDLRVFLFLGSATDEGSIAIDTARFVRAAGLSMVVPMASAIFRSLLPDTPWRPQATYLFYEVAFLGLLLVLHALEWGATRRVWGHRVSVYVMAYYGLWALSDVLILVHVDAGYLLRVLPNLLYYGGLLAVVSLTWPARRGVGLRPFDDRGTLSAGDARRSRM